MENVGKINESPKQTKDPIVSCNCRDKKNCPMDRNCRFENIVHKCTVSSTEKSKEYVYIGVAEGDWKQRYYNETMSLTNQRHKNDPALSTFL